MKTVYKVRDPKTGLFQRAGVGFAGTGWARWSKSGKTWSTAGHLRQHFTLIRECAGYPVANVFSYTAGTRQGQWTKESRPDPIDPAWEILEYDVVLHPTGIIRAQGFMEKK